jgi:hypothetical protein
MCKIMLVKGLISVFVLIFLFITHSEPFSTNFINYFYKTNIFKNHNDHTCHVYFLNIMITYDNNIHFENEKQ